MFLNLLEKNSILAKLIFIPIENFDVSSKTATDTHGSYLDVKGINLTNKYHDIFTPSPKSRVEVYACCHSFQFLIVDHYRSCSKEFSLPILLER